MTDSQISPFAAADLGQVGTALDGVNLSAGKVSKTLASTFSGAIAGGKSFEQTLQSVGQSLSKLALGSVGQQLGKGLASLTGSLVSSLFGGGGSPGGGSVAAQPFAEGGIVARPTFFGSGGGLGLMGERGAEAIVPLSRGPDGRLGLAAGGGASRAANVTVQIQAADPESFRQSQVQIAGALARAVARGQRAL